MEQKSQAEAIASSNLERQVEDNLDDTIDPALAKGREIYEEQVRKPLIRFGVFPDAITANSSVLRAEIGATFAESNQLGAPRLPPDYSPTNDLTVQIHQSMIQNLMGELLQEWLRDVMKRLIAGQTGSDLPPFPLPKQTPAWFRDFIQRIGSALQEGIGSIILEDQPGMEGLRMPEDLEPMSFVPESETPVEIEFDDGEIKMHIRAASFQSGTQNYEHVQIDVNYNLVQEGGRLLLKRDGKIDVKKIAESSESIEALLPSDSDEQDFLEDAARMMNERADLGHGLLNSFEMPPLDLPRIGKMKLSEIDYYDGWLTIGWRKHIIDQK